MRYGLLGEVLGHSFSKSIHNTLGNYSYDLLEVKKDELDLFMKAKDFAGLNVTIPYKESVIPYLDYIDDAAKSIGAVNTIVNKAGRLYGYNTDFYGMVRLISHAKILLSGKKVIILGTGGTSKTAMAVSKSLGAREILRVSRSCSEGVITYDELYQSHTDADVLINTTPVGMYPNSDKSPIEIDKFTRLGGVIDAIYNPLRTPLILEAKKKKIKAEGGLYMLVAQAVRASEIFLDKQYDERTVDKLMRRMTREKENIVLIGMPASGKSTVGKILEKKLGKRLVDTDKVIESRAHKSISKIFEDEGESYFRDLEAEVIREISMKNGIIIATGGGSVLRSESVDNLKKNGRLYFIDRPLSKLIPTASRPLASNIDAIEKRYNERYGIYSSVCDLRINSSTSAPMTADKIIADHYS